ncbi:hypothetical protein BKA70DRAFT_706421 [Coprinopsis sp. MPI-PUGE-AT-0042]|nr:hypothetical protein BKA70DRAFT_706421 [Coprinopsis sp. MPI-PUGE-AT-0042]
MSSQATFTSKLPQLGAFGIANRRIGTFTWTQTLLSELVLSIDVITNIGRLLAIWTELNPKQWWTEDEIKSRNGETIRKMKPTDPLKPFHVDTKGTFFSPDNSRQPFDPQC